MGEGRSAGTSIAHVFQFLTGKSASMISQHVASMAGDRSLADVTSVDVHHIGRSVCCCSSLGQNNKTFISSLNFGLSQMTRQSSTRAEDHLQHEWRLRWALRSFWDGLRGLESEYDIWQQNQTWKTVLSNSIILKVYFKDVETGCVGHSWALLLWFTSSKIIKNWPSF